jgi:hypothetical protein
MRIDHPAFRASAQFTANVRRFPKCSDPVGEGANREHRVVIKATHDIVVRQHPVRSVGCGFAEAA